MKKIFSLIALAVSGLSLFTACSDDNGSNPTVVTPASFTVHTPELANVVTDLSQTEAIRLTWDTPLCTANGAPIAANGTAGLIYDIEVSANGQFTKSYAKAVEEAGEEGTPAGFDYVTLEETGTTAITDVLSTSINKALNRIQAGTGTPWEKGQDIAAQNISIRVKAKVLDASAREAASILSNVVTLTVVPFWVDLNKGGKAAYLWMPGGACAGGWGFGDLCPVISSEANDGIYTGYAHLTKDGEFKFTLQPEWAAELNNGSFSSASDNIDLGDMDGNNLKYTGEDAMCYIEVNTNEGETSVKVTPVKWGIVGAFNGWSVDDGKIIDMTYDAATGAMVAEGVALDGGWKFARDNSWTVNFGGDLDALEQDGPDINTAAGSYKVCLFLENAQKGPHATVK